MTYKIVISQKLISHNIKRLTNETLGQNWSGVWVSLTGSLIFHAKFSSIF